MSHKLEGKILIQANFQAGFSSLLGWEISITDKGWLRQSFYPYGEANTRDIPIGEEAVLQLLTLLEEKQFMQGKKRFPSSIYDGFSDPGGHHIFVFWNDDTHIVVATAKEDTPEINAFFEVWDAIHKHAPVSDQI
jgi:hypothetical protein